MCIPCVCLAQEDGAHGRECRVNSRCLGSRCCLDCVHEFVEELRDMLDRGVHVVRLLVLVVFVLLLASELFERALRFGELVYRCFLPLGRFLERLGSFGHVLFGDFEAPLRRGDAFGERAGCRLLFSERVDLASELVRERVLAGRARGTPDLLELLDPACEVRGVGGGSSPRGRR